MLRSDRVLRYEYDAHKLQDTEVLCECSITAASAVKESDGAHEPIEYAQIRKGIDQRYQQMMLMR